MGGGARRWAIAGGRVPLASTGREPDFTSHDAISILNPGDDAAEVRLTILFADGEPAGPFTLRVEGRRLRRVRVNDLINPRAVPLEADYAALVEASVPVVVQLTRQSTGGAAVAVMGTTAFPDVSPPS